MRTTKPLADIEAAQDVTKPSVTRSAADSKQMRKQAGTWLKQLRAAAGLSQIDLAAQLGLKYYTFVSQVENGFGRVPTESMANWAAALQVDPSSFARHLLSFYEPELYRLLFGSEK